MEFTSCKAECETWNYNKKKFKKIEIYWKSVQKEPTPKGVC